MRIICLGKGKAKKNRQKNDGEKKLSYIVTVVEGNRKMNEANVHFIPFLMRFYPR